MLTSYIILTLSVLALTSDLWRRAAFCVMINEFFEIIFYDAMVEIVKHADTNAFLYFAAKDSLLILCLLYFCLKKEAEFEAEELPTEMLSIVFGFMVALNMNIHICVQTGMYNFIFDNYQNIYMGMQAPLCLVLLIGIYDGSISKRTNRGLYE